MGLWQERRGHCRLSAPLELSLVPISGLTTAPTCRITTSTASHNIILSLATFAILGDISVSHRYRKPPGMEEGQKPPAKLYAEVLREPPPGSQGGSEPDGSVSRDDPPPSDQSTTPERLGDPAEPEQPLHLPQGRAMLPKRGGSPSKNLDATQSSLSRIQRSPTTAYGDLARSGPHVHSGETFPGAMLSFGWEEGRPRTTHGAEKGFKHRHQNLRHSQPEDNNPLGHIQLQREG